MSKNILSYTVAGVVFYKNVIEFSFMGVCLDTATRGSILSATLFLFGPKKK